MLISYYLFDFVADIDDGKIKKAPDNPTFTPHVKRKTSELSKALIIRQK